MPDDEDNAAPPAKGRFAELPPRIALEDLVEETDASTPPDEPTSDPNRDVANRWGVGMVGY
jgi:hypothetical protein